MFDRRGRAHVMAPSRDYGARSDASEGFEIPLDTEPMEAKAAERLPAGDGLWQYEPKWDGFRCLAFKAGDAVKLRAKSGKSLGRFFPEVVAMLREVAEERFVLDGELVIEIDGRLAFDALQMRLHPAESRIRKLSSETPARLVVFDMLAAPDAGVMNLPLEQRRRALEAFMTNASCPNRLVISPATRDRTAAEAWLRLAGRGDLDGVVAKRLDAAYKPGRREMIKVKQLRTADCVVGGFRYESGRGEVGSLLLGLYDDRGSLDHVGFTATITDAERPALTRRLEALREAPGFTGKAPGGPSRWKTERSGEWEPLRPEIVVEVRFDHVTGDRFRHGTKLMRWRPDKAPRQCTFEQIKAPLAEVEL
jgi:ATP-dependent DNA ligase